MNFISKPHNERIANLTRSPGYIIIDGHTCGEDLFYFIPYKEWQSICLYIGEGLEAGLWEGERKWSLVNVLLSDPRLSHTSDRLTVGINPTSGCMESCMFGSVLIHPISVFLSGWANSGPHASYCPASTIQWVILVKYCSPRPSEVSCNTNWIWNQNPCESCICYWLAMWP